jgi:hypothetical protein
MSNRPANRFLIFFLVIAVLVIAGSYMLKRKGVTVAESGDRETSGTVQEAPVDRHPEIGAGKPFVPYAGTVKIENDISAAQVRSGSRTALDGMNHEEIARFRLDKVERYRQLNIFHSRYHPFKSYHKDIYGSITAGKDWLPPAAYYIANPYVLIVMTCANHVTPLNYYCPDVSITYDNGVIEEVHSDRNAACWFSRVFKSEDYPGRVRLMTVNARDAGFFYIYVDVDRSMNVKRSNNPQNLTNCATTVRSFYHMGKYGVNNISPAYSNHWLSLEEENEETLIYVKLWREKPSSVDLEADLVYVCSIATSLTIDD